MAQEALSNVGRHSKASYVHVTLTIGWLFVVLKIADNGQGIHSAQLRESNVGISSMHERMKEIDGSFSLQSKPFVGTEIIATYHSKETHPNVAILPTVKKYNPVNLQEFP